MLIGVGACKFERAMTTTRTYLAAAALLLGGATLAAAATTGEFDNECVMGLALGKDIATDCSVNTVFNGRTYCFGNEQAKTIFLKKPEEFLTKAQVYYSSKSL
jgi:YHS domain-containing protein